MAEKKVKLLLIDDDADRVYLIKARLNEKIYAVEWENDWENGLKRIQGTEYNVIILNHKLTNYNEDALWFLNKLSVDAPESLYSPFLIYAAAYDIETIEKKLKVEHFKLIDKDKDIDNFLGEIEWAILNFLPHVFYIYRENIERSLSLSRELQKNVEDFGNKLESIEKDKNEAIDSLIKKNKSISDGIVKHESEITEIWEDQYEIKEEIKEKYVSWRDITETLGLIVGAFTFVVGIIVSLIVTILKLGDIENFKASWILIAGLFLLLATSWGFIVYFCVKSQSEKIIKKEIKRLSKKREKTGKGKMSNSKKAPRKRRKDD